MATLIPVSLTRPSAVIPWGFRLEGGADYKRPLLVQRVTPSSIASQHLSPGDAIIMLEGEDARAMCHFDACDLVKHSGRRLSMTVRKASTSQRLYAENISHQEKLEQTVVEEQKQQEQERQHRRAMSTPPRDAVLSNRSTPQRILSPVNTVTSPLTVTSPGLQRNPLSTPPMMMSPRPKVQQQSNQTLYGLNQNEPPSVTSPHMNQTYQSVPVRNSVTMSSSPCVFMPSHMTSPPNIVSTSDAMSPPVVVSPPNIMSPPFMLLPPPGYPTLKSSQSISNSEKYDPPPLPQTFFPSAEETGTSSYSTPGQMFSPNPLNNQVHAADQEANVNPNQLSAMLQDLQQKELHKHELPDEPAAAQIPGVAVAIMTEDVQRRQLQLLIQEKLRLEEKIMIAKRIEGRAEANRQERMAKHASLLNKENQYSDANIKLQRNLSECSVGKQNKFVSPNVEQATETATSSLETHQQEVVTLTSRVQNAVANTSTNAACKENMFTESSTVKETKHASTSSHKIIDYKDNDASMLERIKKTARDKLNDLQKALSMSRSLDETEKEQLREENRIRDEEIRKMQEHNLDQKQKRGSAKSASSQEIAKQNKKKQELRRVKTDTKRIQNKIPSNSEQPISQTFDESLELENSNVFGLNHLDEMNQKREKLPMIVNAVNQKDSIKTVQLIDKDAEKSKLKELRRKEDLKRLQEQFRKDQQVIQKEMQKRQIKAREEQEKRQEADIKRLQLEKDRQAEEKKILAKLIYDEEQKLLEQKKILEEKIKREELEKAEAIRKCEVQRKIEKERQNLKILEQKIQNPKARKENEEKIYDVNQRKQKSNKNNIRSIQESYESTKMKTYEQKRVEMQKAVEMQHKESARKLSEKLRQHHSYTAQEESNIYEDVGVVEPTQEEKLEALKQEEERQMRQEAQLYANYRLHLEAKRKSQMYDSEDGASERDDGSEISNKDSPPKLAEGLVLDHEEPFDELKATSEEELLEAQEKSIRNLERQIRKQRENEKKEASSKGAIPKQKHKTHIKKHSQRNNNQRPYFSTGDLSKSSSRTLPITKFSPDPMEFGFKPIVNPVLSKSLSHLESGGSAAAEAALAGAQAGAKATAEISSVKKEAEANRRAEALALAHSMSASLGDLQQVSSKPPLPAGASSRRMRHATSEEVLCRHVADRGQDGGRRFSYADGEVLDYMNVDPLGYPEHRQQQGWGYNTGQEEDEMELEDMEEYSKLLAEYYAAYYEAYYQSFYR